MKKVVLISCLLGFTIFMPAQEKNSEPPEDIIQPKDTLAGLDIKPPIEADSGFSRFKILHYLIDYRSDKKLAKKLKKIRRRRPAQENGGLIRLSDTFLENFSWPRPILPTYKGVAEEALYSGGKIGLQEFIIQNLQTIESKGSGRAEISFGIDIDGRVSHTTVLSDEIGNGEAVAAILKQTETWRPAQLRRKAVSSFCHLSYEFK